MWKIQVSASPLREIAYTDKRTGEQRTLRVQKAYLFSYGENGQPNEFPDPFELLLGRNDVPYAAGVYGLSADALYVSDGKLRVSTRLRPASQPAQSGKPAQAAS